jgi:hypothetical protein
MKMHIVDAVDFTTMLLANDHVLTAESEDVLQEAVFKSDCEEI